MVQSIDIHCRNCKQIFERLDRAQKYCSDKCRTAAANARRRAKWSDIMRSCRQCKKPFLVDRTTGHNRRYCSEECAQKAQVDQLARFWKIRPERAAVYAMNRRKKVGRDTLIIRLRKKMGLPQTCEAKGCGEARVLELAHKPTFRRNGAYRILSRYKRHMFWVLCPTCHKVLDRGVETAEQMGLA